MYTKIFNLEYEHLDLVVTAQITPGEDGDYMYPGAPTRVEIKDIELDGVSIMLIINPKIVTTLEEDIRDGFYV